MPVSERIYGKLSDGREVKAYTLSNGGVEVEVLSYGAVSRPRFFFPAADPVGEQGR